MNSPVFSLSPFYAAADKTLGHAAHRVLTLLCGFADPEGLCFPSRKMLSYLTGIENSNLSKYINVLCRKGYLEKVNASGNRYKIIGFKDKQWPMVECGNDYHHENQQHGNSYHEDGNNYHEKIECGNDYHEDGNNYHETGNSVVMITNRTDQKINRPMEQTNKQINAHDPVSVPPQPEPLIFSEPLPEVPPEKEKRKPKKVALTSMPENFSISAAVKKWADKKGFSQDYLDANFEKFVNYVEKHGKTYVNWDSALRDAISGNWAKFNTPPSNPNPTFNTGGNNGYRKYTIQDDNAREAALFRNLEAQRLEREFIGGGQSSCTPQAEPQRRAVFNF
jgi:hypothetical protein